MSQTSAVPLNRSSLHPYEEASRVHPEDFPQWVQGRIEQDLSSFGTIFRQSGSVVHTRRHGIVFRDLKVSLRHPLLRMPIEVRVEWDAENHQLVYHNSDDTIFHVRTPGYADAPLVIEEQQAAVDAAAARIRSHPVWKNWSIRDNPAAHNDRVVELGTGFIAASLPVFADLLFWDPLPIISVIVPMGVGLASGLAAGVAARREHITQWEHINYQVRSWNRNLEESLNSLFTSRSEAADFRAGFLARCEAAGIKPLTEPGVTPAPERIVDRVVDLEKLVQPCEIGLPHRKVPLICAMVRFKGAPVDGGSVHLPTGGHAIHFDGRHFYRENLWRGEVYIVA